MRPIDADALIEKFGGWYVDECTESGFIGTLKDILATEPTIQPGKAQLSCEDKTFDTISRKVVKYKLTALVNEFEEILAHIREREVDESVCVLCEYDGAYMGQSGDWCNECPGCDKDDCFKLKDKYREEWLSIDG